MIEIEHLSKRYDDFRVLADCTVAIARGEVIVVCGPSGSGKSTLIKCVNGLEPFDEGRITVDGISVGDRSTDLPKLRARIGMVFQSFELYPHMSVTENICLAQIKVLRRSKNEAVARARALLDRVGLIDHADKYPGNLSGGQQQRVAVARAVAGKPLILLADEPTGNLDSRNGEAVMDLLRDLHREGATICMVTHDSRFARHAERTIHLFDGRVVEEVVEAQA